MNAIILDGKVYEAVETDKVKDHCLACDLFAECRLPQSFPCAWSFTDGRSHFRYSDLLTNKLKNKL